MVTETANLLNDRNNNNVNVYPSRTPLTKEMIIGDDDHDDENNDIEICEDADKSIDDDTDEENIDVGVEKSDMDDRVLSDPESTVGLGGHQSPHSDARDSPHFRHEDFHDFRTGTSRLPGGDASVSPLRPPPLPLPLPHLHPLSLQQPPPSLNLFHGHRLQQSDVRSRSTSPTTNTKRITTTTTTTTNNNNNNSSNDNDDRNDRCCSPATISPKNNFISKLSFGIDRILNEKDTQPIYNSHHKHPSSTGEQFESTDDLHGPARDLDTHNDLSDPDTDDDRKRQLLSYTHHINRISDNDILASSKATAHAAAVANKTCLPPRMLSGVDLVSNLSPFHGAVLSRDVCRVEPPSLDILPVRPAWPDVYVCPWTGVQRDRFGLVRRVGHPYQNRTPPKRKKPRTAFSRQQVLELEKRFTRQKYLASAERSALAKTLSMTDAQVKTWFQNRRTKWRRQTAEEREIERQAAHKFLLSLRPEDPSRANIAAYGALCGVNQQGLQSAQEAPKSPGASPVN